VTNPLSDRPTEFSDHLVIFTRYPQPGHTKTRLIPELGPQGAAHLQRQMTEHTLRQVHVLQQRRSVKVTLQFAGGDRPAMERWLGQGWTYQPQREGDLGDRLIAAMEAAFQAGASRLVMIGIDCPGLSAELLEQAFATLDNSDGVLGPAADGGYYLIGMRSPYPALFENIAWSTDTVRAETLAIAHRLNLQFHLLPLLSDVDYPADLPVWQDIQATMLSVIVPVLNEAGNMRPLLEQFQGVDAEVIVVDGGSHDETGAIAQSLGAHVITTPPGRARQMNQGVEAATGNLLLFLHADTQLPPGFVEAVRTTLKQPNVSVGAFNLAIRGEHWGLRWVEWGVRWRSHRFQLPYGDQALFCRRDTFEQLGRFPEVPILEDYIFVQRARQQGRVAIAPLSVLTSGRRWEKLGIWKTTVINQKVLLGYALGVPPEQLVQWYTLNRSR